MSLPALYKIAEEFRAVERLYEEEEIDEQTMMDTLDAITGDIEVKAKNIGLMIREWIAEEDAIDKEYNRIKRLRTQARNRIERMREYLRDNMDRCGINSIKSPEVVIKLRNGQQVVEIVDEHMIPDAYLKKVTTTTVSKMDIKQALSEGSDVPGARLTDGKKVLTVR
jgi:hypothetical protein